MERKTFIYTDQYSDGGYPEDCPFNTERPAKMRETAVSTGIIAGCDRNEVAPAPLTRAEMETFHTPDYLDALARAGECIISPDDALRYALGTPDCPIFKNMHKYLPLAAAGALRGAEMILNDETDIVFSPSGGFHHAQPSNASGFCFINDIAIAANYLASKGKKVLFLDIDVHHCDAVQDAFYRRSDVTTVSLHESGKTLFPGTGFMDEIGEGDGKGYTLNIPLPVGTYDGAYEHLCKEIVFPFINKINPDIIMLELGMDALQGDPLAHLNLTNNSHAFVTENLTSLGKPLLVTGGGGYHIENTVRGWALCWSVLCGDHHDMQAAMMGMGGVMLGNTDWLGGLRDRVLSSDGGRRDSVNAEIKDEIKIIKETLFSVAGI